MSTEDWAWLPPRRDELVAKSPEAAAEIITAELAKLDPKLEAEVSDDGAWRQVRICAGRQAELFDRARELAASAPAIPRWSFTALRPARGFEFEFEAGRRIDARALSFEGRETDDGLVIRLLVPNPEFDGWEAIGWQIIEAGIGEEAAARIAALEIGTRDDESGHVLALESLGRYVERHA